MKSYTAREWTDSDVEKMRKLAKAGFSSLYVAKQLRRSHGAVRFKAHKVKVRFNSARAANA